MMPVNFERSVPLQAVSVTVAVVLEVHTVALQAAGALLASRMRSSPVSLDSTLTGTTEPPAKRGALWNTQSITQTPDHLLHFSLKLRGPS